MLSQTFGRNAKALRLAVAWTQATLAERIGYSVTYVSLLERGRRSATMEVLEAYARVFRVSPADLVAWRFRPPRAILRQAT